MVHSAHFQSCVELKESLTQVGLKHDWLIMWNESLIPRARNNLAKQFLETDYQALFFLDSDISFDPEDVAKVWNLQERAKVTVGVYRMKKEESEYAAWSGGELITDLSDKPNPLEVDFAGTGFMCIDRSAFVEFQEAYPDRVYDDALGETWDYFKSGVNEGWYRPEDYAFCEDYRKIGGTILMDTSVKLKHHGTKEYG